MTTGNPFVSVFPPESTYLEDNFTYLIEGGDRDRCLVNLMITYEISVPAASLLILKQIEADLRKYPIEKNTIHISNEVKLVN